MTREEARIEHRHIYETRLGILGVEGEPGADQHNLAVLEADAHLARLRLDERAEIAEKLRQLKNSF